MISICFQGKPLNITVIQVYVPTIDAKEAEVIIMLLLLPSRFSRVRLLSTP